MPKVAYQTINISQDRLELIQTCNEIINEYQADGLLLTLRQLYYQLVSRDVIANKVQEYKRLGDVVNAARMAGLMDWSAIEDRTRNLVYGAHWDNPESILSACASQFRVDRWEDQDVHVDCWIEKEALSGVFERICKTMDVGCFACRGYTSQSEMWAASQRFLGHIRNGKRVVILHFGDHDPSGIDMSRDIEDRLRMFLSHHMGSGAVDAMFEVKRLALNMDQVRTYNPPENPAKSTDSRFASYAAAFGDKSWELDALNPRTLAALVRENVMEVCDKTLWDDIISREAEARGQLHAIAQHYDQVIEFVTEDPKLSSHLMDYIDESRQRITDELEGSAEAEDE